MHFLEKFINIADTNLINDSSMTYFEDFPVHLYLKDRKGKYLDGNNYLAQEHGLNSASDLRGLTDRDFWNSSSALALQAHDKKVIARNGLCIFNEVATHTKHGWTAQGVSYKTSLRSYTNKVIGIIGISFILDKNGAIPDISLFPNVTLKKTPDILRQTYQLTQRQAECLYYLTRSMTIKQIASVLQLSPRTVEHYIEKIKFKLNCYSRSELINKVLK